MVSPIRTILEDIFNNRKKIPNLEIVYLILNL